MAKKGTFVKVFTGNGGDWVVGVVTSEPDKDGKQWVTAFPGPDKDNESLQADASPVLSGPGTDKYEHQPL